MTDRSVLILGAHGRFGAAAAAAFTHAGWNVLAQIRRAPEALPKRVRPLVLPLDDMQALSEAAAGAGIVVHAVNPLYTDWEEQLLPLARQGMDLAERLGARFFLPGNVYGFGEGMPPVLTEETPERPTTRKGELRLELENELRKRAGSGRLRSVVLRAGDFYGAGKGSWLDLAIARSLLAGKLVYPGPLDRPHAWAYLPDLAAALVAIAERLPDQGGPPFATFHFSGHTLTGTQLLDHLEAAAGDLGLTPPRGWRRGGMPWAMIRLMGVFAPMPRAIAQMRYLWHVPHRLDGTRLAAFAGPLRETPPREALRQALCDLGLGASANPPVR